MKKIVTIFSFIAFIVILCSPAKLSSQGTTDIKEIKKNLPKMLGATNVGKEYWFTIPPCYMDESGTNGNFIKIFVTCSIQTDVTVEVESKGYTSTKPTLPNDVIEFNIPPAIGQPYTKTGTAANVPESVMQGAGIHVYSDQPLVVYCMVRFHWTSDGFLCIPVSSLGQKYVSASYAVDPMFTAVWGYKLPNTCGITAAFDNTTVKWTLGGNSKTKTAGGMLPGQTQEWTLQKGDVLMYSTDADGADLSGSVVESSNPVSMVSGLMCANIPNGNQWCDYIAEMDIPVFTWGNDIHIPKIPFRKYSSIIKIFASDSNTTVSKNGQVIGMLTKNTCEEGDAFLEMRMVPLDQTPRSIVISGDKPITATLYNPGTQEDGNSGNSDPFMMAMTPLQQYQKEITFCTPGILGGAGFAQNFINLVYQTDDAGNMTNDIMFAQVVNGDFMWTKVKEKFTGVDEVFSYNINGKKYAVKVITLPGDGVYKLQADNPFAAYSFGYSDYDSYGYPTGAILADIAKADFTPPTPVFAVNDDGSVTGGTVVDYPENTGNRSNLSMIYMDGKTSYNYNFKYNDFIPGQTRTTSWSLKVNDLDKDAQAVLTFSDRRGNDTTVVINYKAATAVNNDNNGLNQPTLDVELNRLQNIVEISVNLQDNSNINISIFNLNGNKIDNIIDGFYSKGQNNFKYNCSQLAFGSYMIVLTSNDTSLSRKIIVSK